jgi:MFS transporter, DHA1 family, multidrug resistance protein
MFRSLLCALSLVLLYPLGIDMYLVGSPAIARDLAAAESQLHYAFSFYLAGMAIAMLAAGICSDRYGRKPVAWCGALMFALGAAWCAIAGQVTPLLVGRLIQGAGAGTCYVAAFAIIRDTLDDARRAKVLAMMNGIICIVPVVAPAFGTLIMIWLPWNALFYIMSLLGLIVLIAVFTILKESHRPLAENHSSPAQPTEKESLLSHFFLSRLVVSAIHLATILTLVSVSPVLLLELHKFSRFEYSLVMAATASVSMAVSFMTPLFLKHFSQRSLIVTGQAILLIAAFVIYFSQQIYALLAGLTLACAAFSLSFGIIMSQALAPFKNRAGVASSVLGIGQICGASLYIWAAAAAGLNGQEMLITILTACGAVSILLMFSVHLRDSDSRKLKAVP